MIRISDVRKAFDGIPVLSGIHLDVAARESVVLIGPSGSGKSTLLKIVAGLVTPDSGTVSIQTENVGMLFQKNALFDSLTVEENLLFPLKERLGVDGEKARLRAGELLAAVGLSGNEKLYPHEISGGMQKRLGIARALIVEPEVILYDDPTAGLDPVTSRMIGDLLLSLNQKAGTTVLAVTNDIGRARQLGDRVFLLAEGRLIPGGPGKDLMDHPDPSVHQFVHGLQHGPLTGDSP